MDRGGRTLTRGEAEASERAGVCRGRRSANGSRRAISEACSISLAPELSRA